MVNLACQRAGAYRRVGSAAEQNFAGTVPVSDFVFVIDHEGGDRTALDDLAQERFVFPQCFLGALLFGNVLQGFDSADDAAVLVFQRRCGEIEPATTVAKVGEKILYLISAGQYCRAAVTLLAVILGDTGLNGTIQHQIGHARAFF